VSSSTKFLVVEAQLVLLLRPKKNIQRFAEQQESGNSESFDWQQRPNEHPASNKKKIKEN